MEMMHEVEAVAELKDNYFQTAKVKKTQYQRFEL